MRKKVEENLGTLGATMVALVFVVAYSFWGMTILNNEKAQVQSGAGVTVAQPHNIAAK